MHAMQRVGLKSLRVLNVDVCAISCTVPCAMRLRISVSQDLGCMSYIVQMERVFEQAALHAGADCQHSELHPKSSTATLMTNWIHAAEEPSSGNSVLPAVH